ncbi:SirA family protein [Brevundimonas sp. MYb46]|nr:MULTISPECIES: sulfurtransferase TusA family protein [unclassified Brevundimonas]PRA33585.1 SirA family protein [Brevundimonas sp. MYb27]PQZ81801.1 SirA family protein [Brevundimonas sp. MYb31]PRB13348.1 SirA family protein [Brevundimonas sp. MYb52]PRB33997.1 SirA family protein [Brevundimonas sp. MYb46]PRB52685.1 SirA family protein [Brevundimonas sp. MYb33]
MSEPILVDARGHRCPVPSLRLRKAMEGLASGVRLTLLATDPMARIDVPYMMADMGGSVCGIEEQGGVLRITVETGAVPTD